MLRKIFTKVFSKKQFVTMAMTMALVLSLSTTAFGAPGDPVDFAGVTLPFTVIGMITTSVNFITLFWEWILLVLGVLFAPTLYGLAMRLMSYIGKRNTAK